MNKPTSALKVLVRLLALALALSMPRTSIRARAPRRTRDRPTIVSKSLVTTPIIDGTLSPLEWQDATLVDISSGGKAAYGYFKHDDEWLYVAVDAVFDEAYEGDPYSWWDQTWIAFDAGNDGNLLADWEIRFGAPARKGVATPLEPGGICHLSAVEAGLGAVDDSLGNVQYELKIPLAIDEPGLESALVGGAGDSAGMVIQVADQCAFGGCANEVRYPADAQIPLYEFDCSDEPDPVVETWAILQLGDVQCCPCQITTRDPTAELGYPHPAQHTDLIVAFSPECSDTVCGRVAGCSFPWVHIEGCGPQGGAHYVLAHSAGPYNALSARVGQHVRLTGVAIEGYGTLGDPLISGYSSLEQVPGCSDCDRQLCDPTSFSALLHEPPDTTTDISGDFYRTSEGIYRATVLAGEPVTKTVELTATGCSALEREVHLVGGTLCGQVTWGLEGASIQGCDGVSYYVGTAGSGLHARLEAYDGRRVLMSSAVFEGYVTAAIPVLADCDDILEISDCSACYSDRYVDGCTEISAPGEYILTYDIHESAAQACIQITASGVTFDGNGHTLSAAEIVGGDPAEYRYAILSLRSGQALAAGSGSLSDVTVRNTIVQADWDIGVGFANVTGGTIDGNTIAGEDEYGIQLVNCSQCDVTHNEVDDNMDGITLMDSENNTVSDNFTRGNYSGIALFRSSGNTVSRNTASVNWLGIGLHQESEDNTILANTIEMNLQHGLTMESDCTGNSVNQNVSCANSQQGPGYHDIHDEDANSGDENICDTVGGWDDAGTTGCTYTCSGDADGDGIRNDEDNCPSDPNPGQEDADGDGVGDPCDPDRDGDGIDNEEDNCPAIANPDQTDGDRDAVGDPCDNCPATPNQDQANNDSDTLGDACDNCPDDTNEDQADGDGDLVGDACDNCPEDANADQANGDGDTVGDVCDNCPDDANADQADGDGDSRGDVCDNCPAVHNPGQENADTDSLGDACDKCPRCDDWLTTDGCAFPGYSGYAFGNKHGTCFGMSWTAAIYDNGEQTIPGRSDKYLYTATVQMSSIIDATTVDESKLSADEQTIWDRIKDRQDSGRNRLSTNSLHGQPAPGDSSYADTVQDELDKVTAAIDGGEACLIILKEPPAGGSASMGKGSHAVVAYDYETVVGLGKEVTTIAVYDPNNPYGCHSLPYGGITVCDCHDTLVVELSVPRQQQGYDKAEIKPSYYTNMKYVSPAKDESWAEQAAGFVNPGGLLVSLHTPGVGEGTAELHVFDSLDRHTGPDGGGGFEEGIPESAFQRDEDGAQHVAIHNDTGERFTIQILAVAAGPVNLAVTEVTGTIPAETARAFHGVALEGGATAQLETGAASDHILRVDNDGDGVFETEEEADTLFIDSDSDGLPDAWEAAFGTEVAVPDASGDPDEDGSTNFDEYREGTDPLDADTDGDGILDDIDLCPGHDDRADSDGDGVADGCDQPPVISNVQVYVPEDGATTATVTWDTDREADSFVRLGTESGSYPDRWEDGTLEMVHQMALTGLDPGQMYTYRVGGTDIGGNTVESAEYTFTTSYLGPPYAVYLPTVLRNAP